MKSKSKFAVSNEIKAGDILLTEQPFAYVLSSKEKGLRCDFCLKKGMLLKCSVCQFVHYCGRVCQKEAWNEHKWECHNLKRVMPKVIPDAARILARIINRLTRGDGHYFQSFYTPKSFRMWKDLMSHYSDLKEDKKRMEHFTSLCMVLNEFLKDISMPNTVEMMGIYGRLCINSFTILDTDMHSIGTAIYLGASVVDHSCRPNAVATFDGPSITIRATSDMDSLDWSQIRISYIDLMQTPYDRQMELLQNYYFLCQCELCLDEKHILSVHSAACSNIKCDNPVPIKWKDNLKLVLRVSENTRIKTREDVKNDENQRKDNHSNNAHIFENGKDVIDKKAITSEDKNDNVKIMHKESNSNLEGTKENGVHSENGGKEDIEHCKKCGTKVSEDIISNFKKVMTMTEEHLKNMKNASITYIDVCKYCLEKQEGLLHPQNVAHAQTLDHAFDSLIELQMFDLACQYAPRLIKCFRNYYGDTHPLTGLLHLKYGKILLFKEQSKKALEHLKLSEKVLKITHGDRHPLYKEELLPLLRQATYEAAV